MPSTSRSPSRLIHGIHPKVLTDYGLQAALCDAADRSDIPVDVELELPVRLPAAVESAAYFVVCEALANVLRHSDADALCAAAEEHAPDVVVTDVRMPPGFQDE